MTTRPTTGGWTYDEFARLPSDGNRYEVIAGELYVTPAPRPAHQLDLARLSFELQGFVREHDLGWVLPAPIDVLFAEGDYLEQDLVFVRKERRGIISDRGVEAAPDLVVEVLSESTAERDRGTKRGRYAHFGVPEYWIVDGTAKCIEVHRLSEAWNRPTLATERLVWRPVTGGPTLELRVADVLAGFA
jgi:Uma2 family endonuclease